nr:PHP-associated domain-containing protein [Candidatus Sigynarchaeota archaeon]
MKVDLHFHTVLSKDSAIPVNPATAKAIKKHGLDGIAITDHDAFGNVARLSRLLAAEGLVAIPGEEVRTPGKGEILCYFIQEHVKPGPWEDVIDAVKAQGGIAVLAHPFDYIRGNWMAYFAGKHRDQLPALLRRVDGLETFNARNYSPGGNPWARARARERRMLATAGSDAHNAFEIGCTYTEIPCDSTSIDDFHDCFARKAIIPQDRENLDTVPLPGYKTRRITFGAGKKLLSGLNSAIPPFKRWQAALHSLAPAPDDVARSHG